MLAASFINALEALTFIALLVYFGALVVAKVDERRQDRRRRERMERRALRDAKSPQRWTT